MQNTLGSYLKNLRSFKKKTLRELEAELGVNNAHLSQIEKGTIEKPSLDLLGRVDICTVA